MRTPPSPRLLTALLAALLTATCGTPSEAPRTRDAAAVRPAMSATGSRDAPLRVFATGETRGHLRPCKCQQGHLGGLDRRGTYLAATARPQDLRVDLGNTAAGTSPTRELRLRTTLDALAGMGYQVFVPGELEAVIADELRAETGRRPGMDIVTANLVRTDGTRPFPAHVERALPDGRRVAVIGLTQPVRPLPDGWTFRPAREALLAALAEIDAGVGLVVVASSLDVADTRAVVAGESRVALAVTSSDAPEETGPPLADDRVLDPAAQHVGVVADFSTYVLCTELDGALRPRRTWRAWLGEDVPGLAATAALIRRHRDRAERLQPDLVREILRTREDSGFVGSKVCAECHAEEHASWTKSKHAHAMATLATAGSARDPDCVPCHLVDVPGDLSTDLRAEQADALGVGCEACHGPRGKHVDNAMLGIMPPGGHPSWAPREVCAGCHRPPEVRTFDFDAAWAKIAHGRRAPR